MLRALWRVRSQPGSARHVRRSGARASAAPGSTAGSGRSPWRSSAGSESVAGPADTRPPGGEKKRAAATGDELCGSSIGGLAAAQ